MNRLKIYLHPHPHTYTRARNGFFSAFLLVSFFWSQTNFYSGMNSLHLLQFLRSQFLCSATLLEKSLLYSSHSYAFKSNSYCHFSSHTYQHQDLQERTISHHCISLMHCISWKEVQSNEWDGDPQVRRFRNCTVSYTNKVFHIKFRFT